jgi:RNA polymerase primary sigma factor
MDRNEIQIAAVEAWINNGKRGTIEAVTGIGKTFISFHAIRELPKGSIIFYLAETTQRKLDVDKDLIKYKEIFGISILDDYDFRFMCYQSAYKLIHAKANLVIADEIHDSLTPEYFKFYENNDYNYIMGLSATVDRGTKYDDGRTKGQMLDSIAPTVFKYDLDASVRNNTSRKLDVYVITNRLDSTRANMTAGTKAKPFYTTEAKNYEYWDGVFQKATQYEVPGCDDQKEYIRRLRQREFNILGKSNKRAAVLYNLPSKLTSVALLLQVIKGKTIVFSNSIEALGKITNYVVSSKNTEKQNTKIRELFDSGKIKVIGSFKMLKQGANLVGATNAIIHAYYSKEKDIIQRLGRLRKDGDTRGSAFIFVTKGTQEEIWFERMMENISEFNIINCEGIDECIEAYNSNN